MNYHRVEKNGQNYVEVLPDAWRVKSEAEALDLIAACGEHHTHRLLLHAASLPEDFYNLRSGLAGAVLQKFSNYRLRVAAIIPDEQAAQGRFGEMVLEANRGSQFRVFAEPLAAEDWLMSQ
jgi:hypothetical protein